LVQSFIFEEVKFQAVDQDIARACTEGLAILLRQE